MITIQSIVAFRGRRSFVRHQIIKDGKKVATRKTLKEAQQVRNELKK